MSYREARDREQLGALEAAIGRFINRYLANTTHGVRQTIILFPGGLGSQLVRADAPYPGDASGQVYNYSTVWLDCSILSGAALELEMQNDADTENKFIIADGFVDSELLNIRPYNDFIGWCGERGLDWFVFGWDWRRRLDYAVRFFLDKFLPTFQARVMAACKADPLQNCALIGHSFGGMVVKLIMNEADSNELAGRMQKAISVGTPFYGYAGQTHRYFEGDRDLNFEGPARITRVVSSLAGGYTLLFLDKETYDRDAAALCGDPHYPLATYPSVDATDDTVIADPYAPATFGTKRRYPANYRFDPQELAHAKGVYQRVAKPLSATANQKFFNLRLVQSKGGQIVNETINSQHWGWIAKDFEPGVDASPITDDAVCPGDGVIPAWSARLVSTPAANIRTLTADLEHMTMMNAAEIQNELASILGLQAMAAIKRKRRSVRAASADTVASREEALKFLRRLQAVRTRNLLASKLEQEQAARRYLAQYDIATLRQLMGRVFVDALKSSSQKLGRLPTKVVTPEGRAGKHGSRPSPKGAGKSKRRD